jgi:hypothetical protein
VCSYIPAHSGRTAAGATQPALPWAYNPLIPTFPRSSAAVRACLSGSVLTCHPIPPPPPPTHSDSAPLILIALPPPP